MSVNKAILIGHLGKDPELKYIADGKATCSFSMATSERWTDGEGQKQERTTWHNVVAWGRQAEVINEYLAKGSQVYIEGRIANRSYEKDGVTKYISEVIVERFDFIGDRDSNESPKASTAPSPDDDLPF